MNEHDLSEKLGISLKAELDRTAQLSMNVLPKVVGMKWALVAGSADVLVRTERAARIQLETHFL